MDPAAIDYHSGPLTWTLIFTSHVTWTFIGKFDWENLTATALIYDEVGGHSTAIGVAAGQEISTALLYNTVPFESKWSWIVAWHVHKNDITVVLAHWRLRQYANRIII